MNLTGVEQLIRGIQYRERSKFCYCQKNGQKRITCANEALPHYEKNTADDKTWLDNHYMTAPGKSNLEQRSASAWPKESVTNEEKKFHKIIMSDCKLELITENPA